jgi:hypothetical protein
MAVEPTRSQKRTVTVFLTIVIAGSVRRELADGDHALERETGPRRDLRFGITTALAGLVAFDQFRENPVSDSRLLIGIAFTAVVFALTLSRAVCGPRGCPTGERAAECWEGVGGTDP